MSYHFDLICSVIVDAEIDFGEGLTISFNGQSLGKIAMPKVQVAGDVGAQLDVTAPFQVADVPRLTSFTKVCRKNFPKFAA
jgi:hypothetical protein